MLKNILDLSISFENQILNKNLCLIIFERCLHKSGGHIQYTPQKAAKMFVAYAKLHNLCLRRNVPLPDDHEEDDADNGNDLYDGPQQDGSHRREHLINYVLVCNLHVFERMTDSVCKIVSICMCVWKKMCVSNDMWKGVMLCVEIFVYDY